MTKTITVLVDDFIRRDDAKRIFDTEKRKTNGIVLMSNMFPGCMDAERRMEIILAMVGIADEVIIYNKHEIKNKKLFIDIAMTLGKKIKKRN
jgi:hypothetical protein